MSVVKGVETRVFVERGWCVCWWVLLGPVLGRGWVGRVKCAVADVVYVWCGRERGRVFVLELGMRGGCHVYIFVGSGWSVSMISYLL